MQLYQVTEGGDVANDNGEDEEENATELGYENNFIEIIVSSYHLLLSA